MEKYKEIRLEKPNTLSEFLSPEERQNLVSLKISGVIGRKDFEDVLEDMCYTEGEYDDDDYFLPNFDESSALRYLDIGETTYVDGDDLPFLGFHALLETLYLPKGIKSTLDDEESHTGMERLKTLNLPEGLISVGGFACNTQLTGLILPDGLKHIEWRAFMGCKAITSIYIPASVETMWGNSFAGCNIPKYEVNENNQNYCSIDGVIYSKDLKTLVAFPSAYPSKHFEVPASTKVIGTGAFMWSRIEEVKLPEGLTTIESEAFMWSDIRKIDIPYSVTKIEGQVFACCIKLEHLGLSDGLKKQPRRMLAKFQKHCEGESLGQASDSL